MSSDFKALNSEARGTLSLLACLLLIVGVAALVIGATQMADQSYVKQSDRMSINTSGLQVQVHDSHDPTVMFFGLTDFGSYIQPDSEGVAEIADQVGPDPVALTEWTYTNIEYNEHVVGYPEATLELRQGNCWSCSVLLTSMLRHHGLDAYACIGNYDDSNPLAKNHMWTLWRPAGSPTYVILDRKDFDNDLYHSGTVWFNEDVICYVEVSP